MCGGGNVGDEPTAGTCPVVARYGFVVMDDARRIDEQLLPVSRYAPPA